VTWFSDLFQEKISEHPEKSTDLLQVTVGIPIFTEDSKNMNNADPTKYHGTQTTLLYDFRYCLTLMYWKWQNIYLLQYFYVIVLVGDEEKQFKNTTKYMLGTTMNHYTHINTKNVNKIWALLLILLHRSIVINICFVIFSTLMLSNIDSHIIM
jgi:hypothetical protein